MPITAQDIRFLLVANLEAADIIGVSGPRISQMIREGRLTPVFHHAHMVLLDRAQVERIARERRDNGGRMPRRPNRKK